MRVQQVLASGGGPESWTVLDVGFAVIEPVDEFLAHLTAIERSPGTMRSYAFDLRDFSAFLTAHEIDWRTVRLEHFGRFVGWLRLLAGDAVGDGDIRCRRPRRRVRRRRSTASYQLRGI
ncbi:site-specific integrase [Nocardia sp. NPDC004168]|uniref:site-specific integrase n=1 Tax=Nocardia sp. NPDC004168 TaxID=3154452 RepID=UPI0033AE183D